MNSDSPRIRCDVDFAAHPGRTGRKGRYRVSSARRSGARPARITASTSDQAQHARRREFIAMTVEAATRTALERLNATG
ncbi:hypothetical protein R4282_03045 [Rhodococcus oxybenzonivorans]|uniref:hypothetical protein n=1 Tax=Rhodococcus oxybenzonivorans TaxID=1990687 RepID=UPI0029529913|nr:hypothetical protein [Rhodococcus oxybenzonivorans]MDV7351996.1 hypothetical protein [Rhodococcus oxybenzonivorans]